MPKAGASASASSTGSGAAAKAPAPPIPSSEELARGSSGLAKISHPTNTWSKITAAHSKTDEDDDVSLAINTVEEAALRARETKLEMVKGAKTIIAFDKKYPNSRDNPACQSLHETFVALSSDASDARKAAKDLKDSDVGKTVVGASARSKSDAVARWRDSSKRMAELAKSGNLPDDALEQSEDRDAANWNPFATSRILFLRRSWERLVSGPRRTCGSCLRTWQTGRPGQTTPSDCQSRSALCAFARRRW